MVNLLYLFLPIIIFIGIITSYTDIKEGKIRNKHLLLTVCCTITLYLLLFLLKVISLTTIIATLINFGIGSIVSVFLWFLGFWSAGDAKLFAVYLFILPVTFYKVKSYTFLTLLVNLIIPALVFFIFVLLIKTTSNEKLTIIKKYFSLSYLSNTFLLIFSIGWLTQLIFSLLKIPSNLLFSILLMMGIETLIKKFWRFNIMYAYVLIAIVRIIFQLQQILTLYFWYSFILFSIGYMIIRGFIFDMSFFLFSKEITVADLKQGMILAENILKEKNNNRFVFKKVPMQGLFSSSQINTKEFLLTSCIEGITAKDIELLKKLKIEKIKIQQTIPFAPFMFLGALIIVIFGIDIISVFYLLIQSIR